MHLGACVPSVYFPYYFLQACYLYLVRNKPGPIHFKSVRLVWQMSRMMLKNLIGSIHIKSDPEKKQLVA